MKRDKDDYSALDEICRIVCEKFRESSYAWSTLPDDLKSKSRQKKNVYPRIVAIMIARELRIYNYTELAFYFHRDHATMIHAKKTMEQLISLYPLDRNIYNNCMDSIRCVLKLEIPRQATL